MSNSDKGISPKARLLYLVLKRIAEGVQSNEIEIAWKDLCNLTGYQGQQAVRRGMDELAAAGYVTIDRQDAGGFDLSNKFTSIKEVDIIQWAVGI